ncbi:hypothetical protein LCGC14_3013080, partial [marine sediment metagenome]
MSNFDGTYVRFFKTGDTDNVAMSTLFYDQDNNLRPLASGEVFYLTSLGWSHGSAFVGNIHDGAG